MTDREIARETARELARPNGPELVLGATGDHLWVIDASDKIQAVKFETLKREGERAQG